MCHASFCLRIFHDLYYTFAILQRSDGSRYMNTQEQEPDSHIFSPSALHLHTRRQWTAVGSFIYN
jgi:hypothetical protein